MLSKCKKERLNGIGQPRALVAERKLRASASLFAAFGYDVKPGRRASMFSFPKGHQFP